MLTFCFGEAKNGFTGFTFTVDVSFSVTEFIFSELKKSAEFIVFTASRVDVS